MQITSYSIPLFLLAAAGSTAWAAEIETAVKPPASEGVEQSSYVGTGTRLGLGYDSKTKLRGEFFQVIKEDSKSALIGEGWLSGSAGGLKLNYHWLPAAALPTVGVRKAFLAVDRNTTHDSKLTLGGGIENENWFWGGSLSHSLSGRRELALTTDATVETISGVDAGRSFQQDITTTTTTRTFERPYDFGVGLIAGHYFEPALLRLYARLDQEWGSSSARQTTFGIGVEKYFANSPISLALNADTYRKNGDFDTQQNDSRVNLMFRYEFGGKGFRPAHETKLVEVQVPVQTPVPTPAEPEVTNEVIEAPAPAAAEVEVAQKQEQKVEMRLVKTTASMSADAFFKLDKSALTPAARVELDDVVAKLKSSGYSGNILLTGHTCDLASDAYNLKLSLRRATSVKNYLVDHGIPSDSLIVEGKGEADPLYPNTKELRHKNRRVDMTFVTYVEKTEEVMVPVQAAPVTKAMPATAPAKKIAEVKTEEAPTPPVQWKTEYIESEPSWVRRALHNTVPHKQAVDVYRQQEKTSVVTSGDRRFVNRAPTAVDDSFAIAGNSSSNLLNVLINDSDPDGDAIHIVSVQSPAHGVASISGAGISYTPTLGYSGSDTFTYTISDEKGLTSTATITVTSSAVISTGPAAVDDYAWIVWGRPIRIAVLSNDSDPDGNQLTITSIGSVEHGTAVIEGSAIRYTSKPDYFGPENFTYTISNGHGGSATATVHVTVVDP